MRFLYRKKSFPYILGKADISTHIAKYIQLNIFNTKLYLNLT